MINKTLKININNCNINKVRLILNRCFNNRTKVVILMVVMYNIHYKIIQKKWLD